MASVTVLAESCNGVEDCGLCIEVCPKDLFSAAGNANSRGCLTSAIVNQAACLGCQACMLTCPAFAIVVVEDDQAKEAADD